MKAIIRGVEVEGSASEMKELIELLAVPIHQKVTPVSELFPKKEAPKGKVRSIGRNQQKHLLAKLFAKKPKLASLDILDIKDAYKKEYGFYGGVRDIKMFTKNVKRAIKLASHGTVAKKWSVTSSGQKRRAGGQYDDIVQILRDNPSMVDSKIIKVYAEYNRRKGFKSKKYSGGFAMRVREAQSFVRKGKPSLPVKPSAPMVHGSAPAEHVRYFHWGINLPYVLRIVQERMPEHFGIKDVMRAILANLNMPIQPSHSKYISLQSSLPKYLRILVQKGYLIGEKFKGQWVFTKVKQPVQQAVPFQQSVKSEVRQPVRPPVAVEEPYSVPMIPKYTLDTIVNTYMGISPESLIGIRAKSGKTLTSNDARYLFKNLMENMGNIQKLYPGKKFNITGQGQWKSIEIK